MKVTFFEKKVTRLTRNYNKVSEFIFLLFLQRKKKQKNREKKNLEINEINEIVNEIKHFTQFFLLKKIFFNEEL